MLLDVRPVFLYHLVCSVHFPTDMATGQPHLDSPPRGECSLPCVDSFNFPSQQINLFLGSSIKPGKAWTGDDMGLLFSGL